LKLFTCGVRGQTLYFHNVRCLRCEHILGFAPDRTNEREDYRAALGRYY